MKTLLTLFVLFFLMTTNAFSKAIYCYQVDTNSLGIISSFNLSTSKTIHFFDIDDKNKKIEQLKSYSETEDDEISVREYKQFHYYTQNIPELEYLNDLSLDEKMNYQRENIEILLFNENEIIWQLKHYDKDTDEIKYILVNELDRISGVFIVKVLLKNENENEKNSYRTPTFTMKFICNQHKGL